MGDDTKDKSIDSLIFTRSCSTLFRQILLVISPTTGGGGYTEPAVSGHLYQLCRLQTFSFVDAKSSPAPILETNNEVFCYVGRTVASQLIRTQRSHGVKSHRSYGPNNGLSAPCQTTFDPPAMLSKACMLPTNHHKQLILREGLAGSYPEFSVLQRLCFLAPCFYLVQANFSSVE